MRKVLALSVMLLLCLSLISCTTANETGKQTDDSSVSENQEEKIETISYFDLNDGVEENAAKAQLNIGKATTVAGKICKIEAEYCQVGTFYPDAFVDVYMPVEVLAEMHVDQIVAIPAIVKSYNSSANEFDFTAISDKTDDFETADKQFKTAIEDVYSDIYAFDNMIELFGFQGLGIFSAYAKARGDEYLIADEIQLHDYLVGYWLRGSFGPEGTVEFRSDNTYLWKYTSKNSYTGRYSDKEQDSDWSIVDGKLDSFMGGEPQTVYILSDNAFVCNNTLHIRDKNTEN